MLIVDAQVHIWNAGKVSAHHLQGRPDPFTLSDLQSEMRSAGVDRAVLAPPTWDPNGNTPSLQAAQRFPGQFAVTGNIDTAVEDPQKIRAWRAQPGMLGLRLIFNSPEKVAHLSAGAVEWIWRAAEAADLPIMLLIPAGVARLGPVAERHPGLRLCIDHLGIPRGMKDAAAFAHLPELLELAKYPNVSVKAGGTPTYSTLDAYPYPSLHGYLRRVYDAFGPERIFWATDLTRMTCPYRECVTLFTEELPWLSQRDKELIMGQAVCKWLAWPLAAADPDHQPGSHAPPATS